MRLKLVYGVPLFFCNECYGFSFRLRDVEKLSSVKFVAALWKSAETAPLNFKIKCPSCREPCREITDESRDFKEGLVTLRQRMRLEICRSCHLGWMKLDTWTISSPDLDAMLVPYSKEFYLRLARVLSEMEQEHEEFTNAFSVADGFKNIKRRDIWRFAFSLAGFVMNEKLDDLREPPRTTYTLMLLMMIVSVVGFRFLSAFEDAFAVRSEDSFVMQSLTSVSSFFVHANFFHLLSNLIALWVFGPTVEDYLGQKRYLGLIFLASWLGAMFTMISSDTRGEVSLIGASSGLFGVIVFYGLRFWQRRVLVYKYLVPSWMFLFATLFIQSLGWVAQLNGGGSNIGYSAHWGGAVIGAIAAFHYRWSPTSFNPAELRGTPGDFERDTKNQFDLLRKIRSVGRKLLR